MSSSASLGGSKSKSKSGASFGQDVWGPQSGALSNLYGNAANLFSSLLPSMTNQIGGTNDYMNNVTNAANSGWQNLMGGGAYQNMDLANNLSDSLSQSLNKPSNTQEINNMIMGGSGNNYADAMKSQYVKDADAATKNMLANMDARAAASGMSGGSRHGTAIAKGFNDINTNLQSNLARTGYETFDKDLDRKLQIAGAADSNTLARQNLMSNMLGNQNTTMSNAVSNAGNMQNLGMGNFASFMMPWQMMNEYANTVGGPTVLSSGNSSSGGSAKGAQTGYSGGK